MAITAMNSICATAAAVLLLSTATMASSATATDGMIVDSVRGTVSFPLIPHHVQRRRRGLSDDDDEQQQQQHPSEDSTTNNFRSRRRRKLTTDQNNNEIMAGLYQGYGTHYADLWVGTPPQRQTVIVDTGSVFTAFPCSECEDCGSPEYHIDNSFQESMSSTFRANNCDDCQKSCHNSPTEDNDRCEVSQSYSEGSSWEAYKFVDTSYIGGFHNIGSLEDNGGEENIDPGHAAHYAFETHLGCQTQVTGLFQTQLADGILGMCDSKQAFWHQMFRANKIREKRFSLCYTRPPHALREGSEAGAFTLGGSDPRLHDGSHMVYSTTVGTSSEQSNGISGYFDIHVREIYLRASIGGESATPTIPDAQVLKIDGAGDINDDGGVIVDSGTTDTYFSALISSSLREKWEELADIKFQHEKMDLTAQEVARLPTILIQIAGDKDMNYDVMMNNGKTGPNQIRGLAGDLDKNHPYDVIIAVPPSHYMEPLSDGQFMNRIYATETDGSVLGANVMMGHDVHFDSQNMRLGWAESSCDYHGLVEDCGYPPVMGPTVAHESEDEIEEEDEEEEEQEDEKEEYDEEHAEEEIEEDNANIEEEITEEIQGGEELTAYDDDELEKHFTKTSTTIEINLDGILDNPGISGGVLAVVFLSFLFCTYLCCAPVRRRRKRRRTTRKIQMRGSITGSDTDSGYKGHGGYKDDFQDEDNDSDSDDSDSEVVVPERKAILSNF